jgi:proteasome accessory factor C
VLPVVRQALERSRRLHLGYHVPGRDEVTERDVDPMRLLLVEGRSYLEAWCRRAEGVRLFRLDRVERVGLLDAPAEIPAGAAPRDVSQGLFRPGPDDLLVTLALRPGAAWVADYHPCESVQDSGDGGLVVRLRTGDTAWVRRLALRLGTSGRVVAPAELAEQVRQDAALALAAYDS